MAKLKKLKTFFTAERQATASLQAPDDLAARIQALAADYYMREQATTAAVLSPEPTEELAPIQPTPSPAAKPAPLPRLSKRRPPYLTFAAAVAMAALIICAIGLALPKSELLPQGVSLLVEIKPAYAAGGGMDASAGFVISASQPLPAELVREALHIYPGFDYQLQEEDGSTYRVVPQQPLKADTVYHVSFDPERTQENQPQRAEYSWSFQTEPAFAVLDISPSDTAQGVPAEASLVLIFNKDVDEETAALISIEPRAEGVWQAQNTSLVFTPDGGWEPGRSYTVRVQAELAARDGSPLGQSLTSRFTTEQAPAADAASRFTLGEDEACGLTFRPGDIPRFSLLVAAEDGEAYTVRIFALPDAEAYAAALYEGAAPPSAELPLAAAYEISPELTEDGATMLYLPQALPRGFYVAEIEKGGYRRQTLAQVSGLSAYLALGKEDRLLWLHDADGQPVAQAAVSRWPKGEQGQTDENGLAQLTASAADEGRVRLVYCLHTESEALVAAASVEPPPPPAKRYYYYLYTEQSYYSAGQTVRFFGFCETPPAPPECSEGAAALSIRLKGPGLTEAGLPYSVTVEAGAFSGRLTLPGLDQGLYELALYAGEEYVGGRYIRVGPAQGLLYSLSIQPGTAAAWAGEAVSWLVEASADGQGLAGLTVLVEDESGALSMTVVTDSAGRAELILPAPRRDNQPYTIYSVRTAADLPGVGEISAAGCLYVLQYQAFVEAVLEPVEADSYHLQLTAFSQALPDTEDAAPLPQALRQPFTDIMSLTATLVREEEEIAADTGDMATAGTADEEEETELSFTLELADGQPLFQEIKLPQPGRYSLLLSGEDQTGRAFELSLALPEWQQGQPPLTLKDAYAARGEANHYYAAGEELELTLYHGDTPLSLSAGATLFVLAGPRITDSAVILAEAAPQATAFFGFSAETAYGWAVYYQDGQYQVTEALPLYGEAAPQARLTVRSELQSSENWLHLQLSDGAGQPLSATLNVQLLSQAPGEPPQLPAATLGAGSPPYQQLIMPGTGETPLTSLLTAPAPQALEQPAPAEDGESALFVTLTTDEQGFTTLELPQAAQDGSWFLLWQAYEPEQKLSASGVIPLELELQPTFAISSRLAATCLEGDTPLLLLTAGGSSTEGQTVRYEISLPELGFIANVGGLSGEWCEIELPALPAGQYQLTATAACASQRDEQLLPLAVQAGMEGAYELQQRPARGGLPDIDDPTQDVTLIFSGRERAADLAELTALAQQDTVYLEQKLAARLARSLLRQFGAWTEPETEPGPILYQQADGGLAPLPQAPSQRQLSALAAPLVADEVDRAALAAYLRRWYEQAIETGNEEEQALALSGLAALDQPVLLAIERLLAGKPSAETLLNLALAALAAGNGSSAKALTLTLLNDYSAQTGDGLIRAANFPDADEERLAQATAHLAVLANVFELPQAAGLTAAMRADAAAGFPNVLAQARILQARCRRLPSEGYFGYRLDGQTKYIDLRDYDCYRLTLSAAQAAELSLSEVAGGVTVSMIAPRRQAGAEPVSALADDTESAPEADTEPALLLTRSYQQQQGQATLTRQGLCEIRLDFSLPAQAPPGWYQISDTLPAGLRFCAFDAGNSSRRVWLLTAQDRRVSFNVYKGAGAYTGSVVYTALTALPGRYTAPAPAIHAVRQPEIAAIGLLQQVEIE